MNEIPQHHNYGPKNRFPPSDDDLSMVTLLKEEKKHTIREKMVNIFWKYSYREKERFKWK